MDPQSFIGRCQVDEDIADPARFVRLAATLDHDQPPWLEGMVPPLGHWLCFQPDARHSNVGPDGHPVRSDTGLLPNVDLPRRMWAGSRVEFRREIEKGAAIRRVSTLVAATPKSGRSGEMLFVTVRHEIGERDGEAAIVEEQDIVYREAAAPGAPLARPAVAVEGDDEVVRIVAPDPVMLFRYSALTFNSHRIHYDRDYARDEEGYPGLVVQGPLIATLLMDHLLRQKAGRKIARYSFRAMSPMYDGEEMRLGLAYESGQARLRAIGPVGVAMTAQADFSA
ncbi:FAS1-like dehydratase domain-containing protein [Sphingobium phenoxybenzoativorans]|nr:MaoC family dehydratase N-terminal domain-containing protein [Sphingobium phenoxybenzoativorans]